MGSTETALPLLALKNSVLFPYIFIPLSVSREESISAIESALLSEDKSIGVFAQRDMTLDRPTKVQDLFQVGTRGIIKKISRSDSRTDVLVQGVERLTLLRLESIQPHLKGLCKKYPMVVEKGTEAEAIQRAILDLASKIFQFIQPQATINVSQLTELTENPYQFMFLLASILDLNVFNQQEILETGSMIDGLRRLFLIMSHEAEVLELRRKITSNAQAEMTKQQREYMLRQQIRAIQDELGESSPEKPEIPEIKKKAEQTDLPENVKQTLTNELTRLEQLPLASPEYHILRSYLDFLLSLPWRVSSPAKINLALAREVLDRDHFNLEEIKTRILEHLAVLKLNPNAKAPILCLVGPPGVGKTSIGRSIAKALDRKFEGMSLGGLHDEAELRGHRRTYVGAMPGRILQAVKRAGVNNPLLMLDEVDKVGHDFRGDPAAALLEILDPEQNANFRDNYLEMPFDLSKIFFITTANTVDSIASPLLDRMEVLRLSGYSEEEKVQIAQRYLIPRRISHAGLSEFNLAIPIETLREIIRKYTHEAGVRELERMIGRLTAKIALSVANSKTPPQSIAPSMLFDLLGQERFRQEEARKELPAGVAPGLAWTPVGGEILYIEASPIPDSDELRLTGHLGEVMQESAKAAQTYLWSHSGAWKIPVIGPRKKGLHIHVPAGATPKDGPSAGVAIVAAIASSLTGIPVLKSTAMTGEITLSGLVLPVGGIKEKVLAASRAQISNIILPNDNEKDLRDIPEQVRQSIRFILVDRIEKALEVALPGFFPEMHETLKAS